MAWTLTASTSSKTIDVFPEWNDINYTREREQGRFQPLGRQYDVIVSGVRRGLEFEMTFLCVGDAPYHELDGMLNRTEALYLSDGERGLWVRTLYPISITRVATGEGSSRPIRRVTARFIQQGTP